MNKRKWIIFSAAAVSVLLLVLLAVPCILIARNTKTAKAAAQEFTHLLTEGRLDDLRIGFYVIDEPAEESYIYDEEGEILMRFVNEALLAERFGTELVTGEREASLNEQLLSLFMEYAEVSFQTNLAFGDHTTMQLTVIMPDLSERMRMLTQEEAAGLLGDSTSQLAVFRDILGKDEFLMKEQTFEIPMQKQNKKWRFAVSPEIEKLWFCGIIS